jgi:hypothetical protein
MLAKEGGRDRFLEELSATTDEALDPAAALAMRQAVPPDQCWLGLERYWRKRASGGASSAPRAR